MVAPDVRGSTVLYYDDTHARRQPDPQAKCWKGEKACKSTSTEEGATAQPSAKIEAYREFFVPLGSGESADPGKFALRVTSSQEGSAIVYSADFYASKDIFQSKQPGNNVSLFHFEPRGGTDAFGLREQSFTFGRIAEAAQNPSGIRLLEPRRISGDRIRVGELIVDVRDGTNNVVARLTVPLLEND
jgi:hypothetical protein